MVLKELLALRGVSGDEGAVRAYVLEHVRALADEVQVDRMGNVVAVKRARAGGNGRRVMMLAHMDEVGLMVAGAGEDGLLRYHTVGSIDPRVLVSKRVLIGEKRVPGVIGAKAIHLQTDEELGRVLGHDRLRIDIGAKDRADAERLVSPGDYVSFAGEQLEFGDGMIASRALDDRVGCANLIRLLEGSYPADLICGFTVQEEVGLRGATVLGHWAQADCALVLEGTSANDLGDVPEHLRVCVPGRGVAISFMDRTAIGHRALTAKLRALAEERKIPWQVKTFVSGGNDAGRVQTGRGAMPCAVISVPCRNIHSPASVAKLTDVEAQYALARAFAEAGAEF